MRLPCPKPALLMVLLSNLLILSGCATGPLYGSNQRNIVQQSPAMARLIIYREDHFFDVVSSARIEVNGKEIGSIDNKALIVRDLPPGHIELSADTVLSFGRYEVPLDIEAGQRYYLQIAPDSDVNLASIFAGDVGYVIQTMASSPGKNGLWIVTLMDEETALPQITKLHDETGWDKRTLAAAAPPPVATTTTTTTVIEHRPSVILRGDGTMSGGVIPLDGT